MSNLRPLLDSLTTRVENAATEYAEQPFVTVHSPVSSSGLPFGQRAFVYRLKPAGPSLSGFAEPSFTNSSVQLWWGRLSGRLATSSVRFVHHARCGRKARRTGVPPESVTDSPG